LEPTAFCGYELDEYKQWTFVYFGIYRFADLFYGRQCNDCPKENANQTSGLGHPKNYK